MKTEQHDAVILSSSEEKDIQKQFVALFKSSLLPDDEILPNLGLFLTSKAFQEYCSFMKSIKK